MQNEKCAVPSVERTIIILEFLGEQSTPVSMKELSSSLGLPNASVFRIVKYLVRAGYICEHQGTLTTYSLGIKVLQLAQKASHQIDISRVSKDIMLNLAEKSAQTCQLAVLSAEKIMYIDQSLPSSYPVSIIAPLHTPMSANLSATGKVLYAFSDKTEQERLLKHLILEKKTDKSVSTKKDFIASLPAIKKAGYATDIEEYALGIGCIGAPIFDHTGRVIAAIGLTGHIADYTDHKQFAKIKALSIAAGLEISSRLGYQRDA